MRIGIVGAGMAGLACARALAERGVAVRLFDKSRGAGGRMATRRLATPAGVAAFDHGAPCITARDPGFLDALRGWEAAGVAARWSCAGAEAWVGVPAMNAIPKHLAQGLALDTDVHVRALARSADGWRIVHGGGAAGPFDAVVLALPAEQAAPMLSLQDLRLARIAASVRSAACWTLMAAFAEPLMAPPLLRDRGPIAAAVRNSAKPGRVGPESWTVHARAAWSRRHLEADPSFVAERLLDGFARALGLGAVEPLACAVHRWRFAVPAASAHQALWDGAAGLGACGDWLAGPGVEAAWLSGRSLAERIGGSGSGAASG